MVHKKMKTTTWTRSLLMLHTALVAFILIISGCVPVQTITPADTRQEVSQKNHASARTQGEKKVLSPEQTQAKSACTSSRGALLYLEEVQVLPEVLAAGQEIHQRIRYAVCRAAAAGALKGSITRAVSFNGEEMFRDMTDYEFKPGTWTVDVFIGIPKAAGSGTYSLDTTLKSGRQTLREKDVFTVKNR
jgi:hypothetical protein